MGLRPWEFWRLTPAELEEQVEGYRVREEREWYRTAWLACYVLAPHTKKKLTPEKLLGKVVASGGSPKKRPSPSEG